MQPEPAPAEGKEATPVQDDATAEVDAAAEAEPVSGDAFACFHEWDSPADRVGHAGL
jgi:hypothetical protein